MRWSKRAAAACLAAAMGLVVVPITQAQAATTYDIQVGADFFEMNPDRPIPGFSLRMYPSSIVVQEGDVLHFSGFGAPLLHRVGEHPEEWIERNATTIGDPYFDVVRDPDEGDNGFKFNDIFEQGTTDCTIQTAPCQWAGVEELLNPGFVEEAWVQITAQPGEVLYASFAPSSYLRIEVISVGQPGASTQEGLDARAAQMIDEDYNNLAAIHYKYQTRRSWHLRPNGTKVFDAWAGIDRGPLSLEAMYPSKFRIRRGDTVQWHFDLDFNAHTVTMPVRKAFEIVESYDPASGSGFGPQCDPDGDQGAAPDTAPTGPPDAGPPCPEGSMFEFDLNPREIFSQGDGVYTGTGDFEHSGVKSREQLQPGFLNGDPYNVRFTSNSNRRGFRYMCTIHPFMQGRVVVR